MSSRRCASELFRVVRDHVLDERERPRVQLVVEDAACREHRPHVLDEGRGIRRREDDRAVALESDRIVGAGCRERRDDIRRGGVPPLPLVQIAEEGDVLHGLIVSRGGPSSPGITGESVHRARHPWVYGERISRTERAE